MSQFEFVFPLFALLVGLSMTEMLSGLAVALKSKRDIRVGWMTPLLGMLILINLAMFWQASWGIRDQITATSASFLLVLAVGGAYFLAASMVFPSWGSDVRDLDEHFMSTRTVSLLAIAACNVVFIVRISTTTLAQIGPWWWVGNLSFVALLVLAAFARDRRLIIATLAILIAAHGLVLFLG
jgi:hypothetical protein